MIGMLRGEVVDEQSDRIVVDVGGVGYEVVVPPHQLKALRARHLPPDDPRARLVGSGTVVSLHIHHHVAERDPIPVLFGFNDLQERRFFELLIGVSRFGPAAAAKSMVIAVPDYASRIMTRDVKALSQLPGIGPSKAEQIIAQLRSKMAIFAMMPKEEIPERPLGATEEYVLQAQIALEDLGYKTAEAELMIDSARAAYPKAGTLEELLDAVWTMARDRR
jgi:holliday junction DNA helicase RuvA